MAKYRMPSIEERARAAGWEPLEPAPKDRGKRWRMRCTACGEECSLRVGRLYDERGARCRCRDGQIQDPWADDARSRGWEPLEPAPMRLDWWRMRCTTCGVEDRRQYAALSRCRHGRPLSPTQQQAAEELARTAEERVRDAGWEPVEPFPGALSAGWSLRCTKDTCRSEVRRPTRAGDVRPCRHTSPAPPMDTTEIDAAERYTDWAERYEDRDPDTITDMLQWLKLNEWEPSDKLPALAETPLTVRCIRCHAEQDLHLPDYMHAPSQTLPECEHPGLDQVPELTPEQLAERASMQEEIQGELYEIEARSAGWEPAEPRPAQATDKWLLRCARETCGITVYARVSAWQHTKRCDHKVTTAEQITTERFQRRGWTVLERSPRRAPRAASKKWHVRCASCGHSTWTTNSTPCTHPAGTEQGEQG